MEKNSYETYEFLANSDSDSNQFFVLQDDGTILTVNKNIQYITKVDNDKETPETLNSTGEATPIFDVPAQQYYIEFEGNAPEIISLNDQYEITNGENNVFTNNYLIQSENTTSIQQMETDTYIDPQTLDAHQMQHLNVEAFKGVKQTTDLTEITLTDEQYQILEQKGWLLLESNEKIFVLNTLGLHDITDNEKLIQRLRNELQGSSDSDSGIGKLKIESISNELPEESANISQEPGDVVEYFIANNVPILQESEGNVKYVIGDNVDDETKATAKATPESNENIVTEMPVSYLSNIDNEMEKKCNWIKIKTKYTFKDIPNKIYLGKTVNGKKLFAKVKMRSSEAHGKKIEEKLHSSNQLDSTVFTNLIQKSFRQAAGVSPRQLAYAEAVFSQLLRLPNMKQTIVGRNLVLTEVITSYNENGKDVSEPTMVTGVVQSLDGGDTFVHSPLMLQQLLRAAEDKIKSPSDLNCPEEKTARGLVELQHIHISETRYMDRAPETSINFSVRKLPLDVLIDAKKKYANPTYACATCGAVFKSEIQLKSHQDDVCTEVEDELTIDTDDFSANISTLYKTINTGKEKLYSCTICETKFTRLFNCKKHIRSHKAGIEKKLKAYKCKMCPNTYFHSSTLSKHIVKTHIQTKLD